MAERDEAAITALISGITNKLASRKGHLNKDFLVQLLRQAEDKLPELKQSPSLHALIKPLSDSLVKHSLLCHKDKDVKLLVATCFCEFVRILAPDPGFSDEVLRDIFKLFISMFVELADTTSPYFSRRAKLLETVAKLEFCVLMLDTGSEDLILEMFNVFYDVVREQHPRSVLSAMSSIMALILKEKVSEPLLNVTLQNLLKEAKDASPAFRLAVSVIQNCSMELEPSVRGFLTSCIVDKNAAGSELREHYHEILFEIFKCAPQMLLAVIPNLNQELLTDQVDVRIKAVQLIGRLFALPGCNVAEEYPHVFLELLNRFSDKSAEVRISALSCAKAFYMIHPSKTESEEVLSALEGRLLDFDDKVRSQAVTVVSDLAISNLKKFPPKLISQAAKRLRDKKVSVRRRALQKLQAVYHDYCMQCSEGTMSLTDHFEEIPCGLLMLYHDKDCKEFGPQNMEEMLAQDLFPTWLSIDERTRHWIFLFSLDSIFTASHLKALNTILSQKQRLRTEMQHYLLLRRHEEEGASEEVKKDKHKCFTKMSASFPDPTKAEECFHWLDQVKDNIAFNTLEELLDKVTVESGQTCRDNLLREFGDRHPNFWFLELLSKKCLFSIFSSEHISCILNHLSRERFGDKHINDSSIKLLLTIISSFPSLLRGSEEQFCCLLLEENFALNEDLIQLISKAGPSISHKLSDLYPFLERICLEGTRSQSKHAVSALAALAGSSEQWVFSKLCKSLVDALYNGRNIPTVLQSLGCLAQFSAPTFDAHDQKITQYIFEKIFQVTDVAESDNLSSCDKAFNSTSLCRLKIFGLKALVKSVLPHQHTHVRRQITKLLEKILQMLRKDDFADIRISCEADKLQTRLAAAKSVLRLSRRWDLYVSPQIFHLTVLMAKDPSSLVRRKFVDKTYKLLKGHILPSRYACAFAFAVSDSEKDLQEDSQRYMEEFIREYSRKYHLHQKTANKGGLTDHPVYVVVFLIHILSHDRAFPSKGTEDEEIFTRFCSPLLYTLQALVNAGDDINPVNDVVSNLRIIFNGIKRAEDAIDGQETPKLHVLAEFGISYLNALKNITIQKSHSPSHILLPSSLYKIGLAVKGVAHSGGSDRNISKENLHGFESEISCPVRTVPELSREHQEDSSVAHAMKCSSLNFVACKQVGWTMSEIGEQGENPNAHEMQQNETENHRPDTIGKKNTFLSSCRPGSAGLHTEFSVDDELSQVEAGNFEPVVRNEQPPSICGSLAMRPLISHEDDRPNSDSLRKSDTITKCKTKVQEPSKHFRIEQTDHCSSKDSSSLPSLNGDCRELSAISSSCNVTDVFIADVQQHMHNLPMEESADILNKKLPLLEKEKKGQVSVGAYVSEVTNTSQGVIARRTRRRKV